MPIISKDNQMNIAPAPVAVSQSRSQPFHGWIVIALATFAVAVTNSLSISGMPVFYRSFIVEFGWSRATIATSGALLLVARGLAGPLVGPLWDRYGPKRFMAPGAAILGVALILGSHIGAPFDLYLMVVVMAVGLTFAGMGPGVFLASSWFTARRGIAMGIVITGTSLGGMIFPPISAWLISAYGWRMAMVVYAVFALLVFAPLMLFIKDRPGEIGSGADPDESDWFLRRRTLIKSVAVTAAIMGALIYSPVSMFLTGRFGERVTVLILVVLSVLCLAALAKRFAARAADPNGAAARTEPDQESGATLGEALGSVSYWALLAGSSISYYIIFAVVQQFVLSLQSPQVGLGPGAAAWAYSALFFYSLSGKSLFGFLSDRFPKRAVNLVCSMTMFAGMLVLVDIGQSNAWLFCVLFGLGYGGVVVTMRLVLVELFGLRSLGKLLGVTTGAELIASSGGNLLTGRLFDATGGYQTAFKVMAACSLISVVLMALLLKARIQSFQSNKDQTRSGDEEERSHALRALVFDLPQSNPREGHNDK
jgi:sugar phosphate permease